MSNLSWGMQFRTCGNFWTSTDSSLVDSPKILTNTKAILPLLRLLLRYARKSCGLRFCESQNLGENSEKNAESALDSADSQNLVKNNLARSANPCKSFCYFWLLPKVESLLPLKHNPPSEADSQNLTLDSATRAKFAESANICHSKSFSCHSERSEESKKIRHCEILRETRRIVAIHINKS